MLFKKSITIRLHKKLYLVFLAYCNEALFSMVPVRAAGLAVNYIDIIVAWQPGIRVIYAPTISVPRVAVDFPDPFGPANTSNTGCLSYIFVMCIPACHPRIQCTLY